MVVGHMARVLINNNKKRVEQQKKRRMPPVGLYSSYKPSENSIVYKKMGNIQPSDDFKRFMEMEKARELLKELKEQAIAESKAKKQIKPEKNGAGALNHFDEECIIPKVYAPEPD